MEIPQLNEETGVSSDYWNEYIPKIQFFQLDGVKGVILSFQNHPIKKYIERFPLDKYENVTNEINEERIFRLDEIAEFSNFVFSKVETFDKKCLVEIFSEVHELIFDIEFKDRNPSLYSKLLGI